MHALTDLRSRLKARRGELAAMLLIAAIAATLRFWRLQALPPGLHYDEAFNVLGALRVYRGETRLIYFPENNGEEPMHIYLTALLFALTGPTPLGGRIVSAASGVVTVVVAYYAGVEMFRGLGRREAGRVGLLASLFLALWYWPVHYSRVGMEPSMVPMAALVAVLFIWRAIRTRRKRDALLAGATAALGLYTYPAGRAIPLIVALVVIYHAVLLRAFDRRLLLNLALAAAVALVMSIPLGLFFLDNPEWFFLRPQQTLSFSAGDSPLRTITQGIRATLFGLFWHGDENWRQNLPGRPMFGPVQFTFFLIGAAACARRIKQSPYWFLLLWAGVGLLPTVLTTYPPHFGRALGAVPPFALITGLGFWTLRKQISKRWPTVQLSAALRSALAAGYVGLAFAYAGSRTIDDYFNHWARASELFVSFDVGLRAIGEYVAQLPLDQPVYLSPVPSDWYTLRFAVNDDASRLRSFNGRACLVFPAHAGRVAHEIIIVHPGEDNRSLARLQRLFPRGRYGWQVSNREVPYAIEFVIPAGSTAQVAPMYTSQAIFGERIALLGFDLDRSVAAPGDRLLLRLWWQGLAPVRTDYTVFVHVVGPPRPNSGSVLWAQRDARPCDNSFLTTQWSSGEVIWDDYPLDLPADLPAGVYTLTTGLYDLQTGDRLQVRSSELQAQDNALTLASLEIRMP